MFSQSRFYASFLFLTGIVSLAIADSAMADEERAFPTTSFHSLGVSKDISVNVQCGAKPMVIAQGHEDVLDKLSLKNTRGKLLISNEGEDPGWFATKHLDITVVTDKPLTSVEAKMGTNLTAVPCAISSDELKVVGSMGAEIFVEGKVSNLDAHLSLGANLNNSDSLLDVENANIDFSMGANAYLCHAKRVTGSQEMGAALYVGENTRYKIDQVMGAVVSYDGCW
ncbi:hypothetical protein VINI7043_01755 [Vibrio nigripulchritudo ATCC 27043]|uniref:GIN domain-containing protein n=1 Tax=Vibrio nigripulchritudo TaxID=28173 RepID=UPI00021C3875|nr:DUF2807 domain-containing protein [Vibrio nigripulchritudo]EGU55104.1 hypothetical protein VINI7043_01755 [Vibrio nigripulchritudo ATCC 27043]